jgi:hypothetical protein
VAEEEGSLGALLLKLGIDASEFMVGLAAGEEAAALTAKKMEMSTTAMAAGFGKLKGAAVEFAAVLGVGVGLEAFKSFIERSMEGVEKMAQLSDRIGVSTTNLYGLKLEADESGTSLEALTGAMTRLERSTAMAQKEGSAQAAAFREMGLSVDDLTGKRPDEIFGKVADALNGMGNQTRRTQLEFELFGRGFAEIENVVHKGSAGMEEASEKARSLGDSIDRVNAQKVVEAVETFKELHAIVEAIGIQLSVDLAPYIVEVGKEFIDASSGAQTLGEKVTGTVDATLHGLAYVGNAVQVLKIGWDGIVLAVAVAEAAFANMFAGATQGITFIAQLAKNFGKLVTDEWDNIGTLGEMIWLRLKAAVAGFVQDTVVALSHLIIQMADSLPDAMHNTANEMNVAAAAMQGNLGGIGTAAKQAFEKAEHASGGMVAKIKDDFAGLVPTADDVMNNKIVAATGRWASTSIIAVQAATEQLKKDLAEPWDTEKIDEYMAKVKADMDVLAKVKSSGAKGDEKYTANDDSDLNDYEKDLQNKLNIQLQYANKSIIAENNRYNTEKDDMKAAFAQENTDQATQDAVMENLAGKHAAIINGIQSEAAKKNLHFWDMSMQEQLQITGSTLTGMTELMHSKNREMFEIGKAAAYSRTIINTAEAAMGAYNSMVDIPYVGPALAAAAMASAIAAGAIELSTISSTSFGGGGSPSHAAAGGGGGGGSGPSAPTGASTGGRQGGARNSPTFQLNFAPGLYSASDLRAMNNRLNMAGEDGATTSQG